MDNPNSKRNEEKPNTPVDRERDYLKIQVLSDYYLAFANVYSGLISAIFVGILIVWITLDFQGLPLLIYFIGLGVLFIPFGVIFYYASRRYRRDLKRLSQLIDDVDKGKSLPSLRLIKRIPPDES